MRLINFILLTLYCVSFAGAEPSAVVAPATIAKAGFVKEQSAADGRKLIGWKENHFF